MKQLKFCNKCLVIYPKEPPCNCRRKSKWTEEQLRQMFYDMNHNWQLMQRQQMAQRDAQIAADNLIRKQRFYEAIKLDLDEEIPF